MIDLRAFVPWKTKKPKEVREFEKAASDLCNAAESLMKDIEGTQIALERDKCVRDT